jgi:hypothetical protein
MAQKIQVPDNSAPAAPAPAVSEETAKLQEEAKKTGSFAELLAKMKKEQQ